MQANRKDSISLSGANRDCGNRVPAWMRNFLPSQPEKPVLAFAHAS